MRPESGLLSIVGGVHRRGGAIATVKITLGLAALLIAASASAQLADDQVPHERTLPVSEEIRMQLENSRLRLGVFRLQPTFAVRDFGYDNNVFGTPNNPVGDWHSSVAAGAAFIVPGGSKLYLRGEAVPNYTYYQKLTTRRSLGGDYAASILGLFNRMTVEVGAQSSKQLGNVSSEVERPAIGTLMIATGTLEVDILRRLSLFGVAKGERTRFDLTADELAQGASLGVLERNESLARGGVRYRVTSFFDISAAAEKTRTTFLTGQGRDNETTAAILGVHYDRPRSFVNVSVGSRKAEATDAASAAFPGFSTATGSYYASHELSAGLILDAYGHRGIGYSVTADNAYYLETRNGGGITVPLGQRFALRAFGETGANSYPIPENGVKRTDDVTAYGGGFALRLYRSLVLTTTASNTKYDSTTPGNSRSIFRVSTVVAAQTGLFR